MLILLYIVLGKPVQQHQSLTERVTAELEKAAEAEVKGGEAAANAEPAGPPKGGQRSPAGRPPATRPGHVHGS